MKIDNNKPLGTQGPGRGAQNVQKSQPADQKLKAPEGVKSGPADTVNISSQSKQIADIKAAVSQLPDVRESKVQEIKQSVDAGTYTVDPRKVAEKILKEI